MTIGHATRQDLGRRRAGLGRALPCLSAIAVVVAPSLLWPPGAQAGIPHFSNKTIVIGRSIGGVRIGSTIAEVRQAWGPRGDCSAEGTGCLYRRQNASTPIYGEGSVTFVDGKATDISIQAGDFNTIKGRRPWTTPKTVRGAGIGTTDTDLFKAHPRLKPGPAGEGYGSYYSTKNGIKTTFTDSSLGRIAAIRVAVVAGR